MFSRPVHIWFPATLGPSKPGIWSFQRSETASMVPLRQLPAVTWKPDFSWIMDCSKNVGENWVRFFQAPLPQTIPKRLHSEWLEGPKTFKLGPFVHWTFTEHITAVPTNEIWGILPPKMAISIVKLILHMDFNRVFLQQFQGSSDNGTEIMAFEIVNMMINKVPCPGYRYGTLLRCYIHMLTIKLLPFLECQQFPCHQLRFFW